MGNHMNKQVSFPWAMPAYVIPWPSEASSRPELWAPHLQIFMQVNKANLINITQAILSDGERIPRYHHHLMYFYRVTAPVQLAKKTSASRISC